MKEYFFNLIIWFYSFWTISFFFVVFLTIRKSQRLNSNLVNILLLIWIPFSIIFFGFRDSEIGTDSENYKYMYNLAVKGSSYDYFEGIEYLFYFLLKIVSVFDSYKVFFVVAHLIFVITLLYFLIKFNPHFTIIFILFYSLFFYYNLSINIIRNSLSIPFWLLGLWYLDKNNSKKGVFFFMISFLFHKTAIFIYLSYLLTKLVNFNKLVLLWLIFSLFSALNKDLLLFILELSPFNEYLEVIQYTKYIEFKDSFNYKIGFRLDFWIINFLMISYIIFKRKKGSMVFWDNLFVTLSILSIFSYQFPYSDRTSLFSWFLFPLILSSRELDSTMNEYSNAKMLRILIFALFFSVPSFYLLFKNA